MTPALRALLTRVMACAENSDNEELRIDIARALASPDTGEGLGLTTAPIIETVPVPIPMLIWCPMCGARHLDVGEFATKPHHTHSCQSCGVTWRPAVVPTVGVQFLPGFKNAD